MPLAFYFSHINMHVYFDLQFYRRLIICMSFVIDHEYKITMLLITPCCSILFYLSFWLDIVTQLKKISQKDFWIFIIHDNQLRSNNSPVPCATQAWCSFFLAIETSFWNHIMWSCHHYKLIHDRSSIIKAMNLN